MILIPKIVGNETSVTHVEKFNFNISNNLLCSGVKPMYDRVITTIYIYKIRTIQEHMPSVEWS